MIQRILAPAHIERVAIRQKRLPAQILDHFYHCRRIVGTQKSQITRFPEMDFHGSIFVCKVNRADTGGPDEPLQLLGQVFRKRSAHVRVIHL